MADSVDIHRLVVEHALDLVSVVDEDGRVVYASPSHRRVLGYEPDDLVGQRWLDLAHPQDRETARSAMDARDDAQVVVRLRDSDGRWVLVEGQANTVPGARVRLAVWRDVTARTRAERRRDAQYTVTQLLAAASGLREAAEGVLRVAGERLSWEVGQLWRADGDVLRRVALWTADGVEAREAGPFAGRGELARGETLAGRVWERAEGGWVAETAADRGLPAGPLHAGIAVPVPVGGETWGVLEWAARKERTPDDDRLRVFASFGGQLGLFIERTEAERQAHTSRTMLDAVVDGTLDAVFVKDAAGRYLLINESGARSLGRPIEQVLGRTDDELLPAAQAADISARDRQVMESGQTVTGEETVGDRVFLSTKAAYKDPGGTLLGLIGIAHDVTERRRLEAELQQAQKLEAVGRLAGGVAHDFNNILSVIRGFSDLARAQLEGSNASVDEWLGHVSRATEQGSSLTRQLLAFSRRQPLDTERIAVNGVVADMDALLRRVLGEDLRLVTVFGASPGTVEINRGQLEQVIMNLAVNARDAMPAGGKLTVETGDVSLDGEAALRLGIEPGEYVLLRVSDTGVGMAAETLRHGLRAVLHHQGRRRRHRARALDGVRDRHRARRPRRRAERAGLGHHVHDPPAGGAAGRGRRRRPPGRPGHGGGQRHRAGRRGRRRAARAGARDARAARLPRARRALGRGGAGVGAHVRRPDRRAADRCHHAGHARTGAGDTPAQRPAGPADRVRDRLRRHAARPGAASGRRRAEQAVRDGGADGRARRGAPRGTGDGRVIAYFCSTCAAQFTPSEAPPERCPICEDERQYVPVSGQRWTTPDELREGRRTELRDEGEFAAIGVEPGFAIGQRALLVPLGERLLMWDCIPLLDDAGAQEIERRGGLAAIAISHPHYYTGMVEWARRFDCPVLLHAADARWITRPDPLVELWDGDVARARRTA